VNNEKSNVWQHRTITNSVAQTLKCRSGENICRGLLNRVHSAEPQLDDSESEVVPVHNDAWGSESVQLYVFLTLALITHDSSP